MKNKSGKARKKSVLIPISKIEFEDYQTLITDKGDLKDLFYKSNSEFEKTFLKILPKGNIYRGVVINQEYSKIVARIDDALYNIPAILCANGTSKKIASAHKEVNKRRQNNVTKAKPFVRS